jgi:hypothetical protein
LLLLLFEDQRSSGNGGQESECCWCKDKWGISWQITPRVLTEALAAAGDEAKRAFDAMMGMKKIDVAPFFSVPVSSISPVAIRMTWTALPITSAGRFSPLGPLGTTYLSQRGVCGPWLHYQRPRSQLADFYQFLR